MTLRRVTLRRGRAESRRRPFGDLTLHPVVHVVQTPLGEVLVAALHRVHVRQAVRKEVLRRETHAFHPERAQTRPVEGRVPFEVRKRELLLLRRHPRGEVPLVGAGGVAELERDVHAHRALRLPLIDEILAAVAQPLVRDVVHRLRVERGDRMVVLQHGHRRDERLAVAAVLVAGTPLEEIGLRLESRAGRKRDPRVVPSGVAVLERVAHGAFADGIDDAVFERAVRKAPQRAGTFERRRVAVGREQGEEGVLGLGQRAGRDRHAVVAEHPRLAVAFESARRHLVAEGVVAVDHAGDHPVRGLERGRGADGDLHGARLGGRVRHLHEAREELAVTFDARNLAHALAYQVAGRAVHVAAALLVNFHRKQLRIYGKGESQCRQGDDPRPARRVGHHILFHVFPSKG